MDFTTAFQVFHWLNPMDVQNLTPRQRTHFFRHLHLKLYYLFILREYLRTTKLSIAEIINMSADPTAEVYVRKRAKRDHNWTADEFGIFSFAANSITGFRLDQEDRYTCIPNYAGSWSFFGVYDGHGGAVVAEYLKRKLHIHILEKFEEFGDMKVALNQGFQACDLAIRDMNEEEFNTINEATMKEFSGSDYQPNTTGTDVYMSDELYADVKSRFLKYLLEMQTKAIKEEPTEKKDVKLEVRRSKRVKKEETAGCSSHSDETKLKNAESLLNGIKTEDVKIKIPLVGLSQGSTATVAVFNDQKLYVANVGDSICLASIRDDLYILTGKHFPNIENEKERILASGHKIKNNKIGGVLAMSRAFGDFIFKDNENLMQKDQAVIAEPSITASNMSHLNFIVLASDGVWNELEPERIYTFVENSMQYPLEEIIAETFERVLQEINHRTGMDNITEIIIKNNTRCTPVSEKLLHYKEDIGKKQTTSKKSRNSKSNEKIGKRIKK